MRGCRVVDAERRRRLELCAISTQGRRFTGIDFLGFSLAELGSRCPKIAVEAFDALQFGA
jgi:hypothetical protein